MYGIGDELTAQIQHATDERVLEFKKRLIRGVGKITCDLEMNTQKFHQYVGTLNPLELGQLACVLRLELLQVINAVKEAK